MIKFREKLTPDFCVVLTLTIFGLFMDGGHAKSAYLSLPSFIFSVSRAIAKMNTAMASQCYLKTREAWVAVIGISCSAYANSYAGFLVIALGYVLSVGLLKNSSFSIRHGQVTLGF